MPSVTPPSLSKLLVSFVRTMRWMLALIVLVVGLGLTLTIERNQRAELRAQASHEFEHRGEEVRGGIIDRLQECRVMLLSGRALVTSSQRVSRREWARMVRTLEMESRFPEVLGLGLIDIVPEDSVERWLEDMRANVSPDFTIKEPVQMDGHIPGTDHFLIRYNEPESRNRAAWGLDVSLSSVNRIPYIESMATGEIRMTSGVTLKQAQDEPDSGVVISLPIDLPRTGPGGIRHGWVATPISIRLLVEHVVATHGDGLRIRIYEESPGGETLLSDTHRAAPMAEWQTGLAVNTMMQFGGKTWRIETSPLDASVLAQHDMASERLMLTGLALSLLLSMLVASLTGTRDRAEIIAADRTRSLRQSETRYRSLVDNAPVCIKELDRDARILSMNGAGLELLGVETMEAAVGHTMDEFICPEELDGIGSMLQKAFEGESFKFDFNCLTPGRGRRLFTTTLDPIVEPNGEVRRLISVTSDVTERALAEQGLRESEARYRSLVDSAPVCIKELDLDGRITSINPEGLGIGQLPDDSGVVNARLQDIVIEEDRELVAFEIARAAAGETRSFRYRFDRCDGERIVLETRVVPRRCDGSGEPCCLVSVAMDVTERDRNEERILHLAEEARAASASKTAFLANMSHEIRTPMTAIIGFGEVLEETATDEQRDAVETIRQNSDHLLQIINDILDISKIESGRMTYGREPVDVREFFDAADRMMRHRAEAKGLSLGLEIHDGVPERLHTDETRLRQIMLNLVGNALKFTDRGDVRVRVLPGTENFTLRVEVEDTGPGLDPARAETVFQPFVQGDDSQTRKHGGTGLGLAISRQLATALGGSLRLDTGYRNGARFVLEITEMPADAASPEELRLTQAPADESPVSHRTSRVLLADDCDDNRRLIVHHLLRAGHEVETATDGHEAVRMAMEADSDGHPFDVILMDMQMPRLDGYQATRRLRASGYSGRIVALTAHAMAHEKQLCLEAGCDEFETKPILRDRLLGVINRTTRRAA